MTQQAGNIAGDYLRQFIEHIERLRDERKGLGDDIADIFKQAKGHGFDTKVMKALIAERAKEPNEIAEMNDLLDIYRLAMDGGADNASRAPAGTSAAGEYIDSSIDILRGEK